MRTSLVDLLEAKRVLVTVGSGGVGKTTVAAALALAAARRGRRVLCLTIDPASASRPRSACARCTPRRRWCRPRRGGARATAESSRP
ncbi:MAG: ArsA-related P-loop ATPase [Polyangiales bacterium]